MGIDGKSLVESVLFSAGKPLSIKEIKEATSLSAKEVKKAIEELIENYNIKRKDETSVEIVKAGKKYVMQVKKNFIEPSVKVAKPEIKEEVLKTLTLIAFHQPIKQSNLRRMFGPRIYEHVDKLVAMKLVHSKKHGTTELLTTTKLFPEYFGIESTDSNEIREFLIQKMAEKVNTAE